jgi:hypothetical protein
MLELATNNALPLRVESLFGDRLFGHVSSVPHRFDVRQSVASFRQQPFLLARPPVLFRNGRPQCAFHFEGA